MATLKSYDVSQLDRPLDSDKLSCEHCDRDLVSGECTCLLQEKSFIKAAASVTEAVVIGNGDDVESSAEQVNLTADDILTLEDIKRATEEISKKLEDDFGNAYSDFVRRMNNLEKRIKEDHKRALEVLQRAAQKRQHQMSSVFY